MPVKYKGELEMYFVNGIIPDLCDEKAAAKQEVYCQTADNKTYRILRKW